MLVIISMQTNTAPKTVEVMLSTINSLFSLIRYLAHALAYVLCLYHRNTHALQETLFLNNSQKTTKGSGFACFTELE